MEEKIYTFMCGTRIIHGPYSSKNVGEMARALGILRPFLVAGRGVTKAGLAKQILCFLEETNLATEMFNDVGEDADVTEVDRGARILKGKKCDGVVVVGGGSSICAGRGIALVATNGGSIRDFEGTEKYTQPPLPVIVVSTTAGSGAEVSAGMVIYDREKRRSFACRGPACYANVAILDPYMLLSTPRGVAVAAGLDALTHAVEALCTNMGTPLTDTLAYQAFSMIMKNFRSAILATDLEALAQMHLASVIANLACGNARLGLVHAMTSAYGIPLPHGLKNGIVLPHVMEYNMPVVKSKLAKLALLVGASTASFRTEEELAAEAIAAIRRLYEDLGVPYNLASNQVNPADIPQMVTEGMEQIYIQYNLRKPTSGDVEKLWQKVIKVGE
jgi:alcohol dehydrogenase